MDVSKAFADPEREKTGVWLGYREGSKVKVARAGNPAFQRSYDARSKPFVQKKRTGNLDTETDVRLLCEAIADAILVDWKGFERDGAELKYSKKEAAALLIQSQDFRNEIVALAAEEQYFHADFEEESVKN